jgi:hypothetical protein
VSTEEVLNKAYHLAYFLHQEKGVAIRIVAAATLKLNVAMAVQSKRLYYIPVGRSSRGESRRSDGVRNKALFSDVHLLQRLVYSESEPYERQKERAAVAGPQGVHADGNPASEDDLLVYFTKHLVRITTKRNAFYVTLGVSRLLHSYSTLETMDIYNAVIGEPERFKDDYYYRSRKAVLMHEMTQRFGQLIRACRQRRGEERFETQQGSNEQRSLVRECLRLFTPWDTQCHVPLDFDPLKSVIASLTSNSSADENRVEVNRIHAVLHPDCFARLVAAFGYSTPAERMELPRFFSDQSDDQAPPRQRSAPAGLSTEELAEINHLLDEEAGRRRRSSPGAVIRVIVDGVERARLNPAAESSISFSADEDAELIEVKTMDLLGDLLLATHLLTSYGKHAAIVSIRLEGGQELSFSITRKENETNGDPALLVKFGYKETNVFRAARLWWQQLKLRLGSKQRSESNGLWRGASISARLVLVASVLLVSLLSFLGYVMLRSRPTTEPQQIGVAPTSSPNSEALPVLKAPEPEQHVSPPIKNDRATAIKSPPPSHTSPTPDAVAPPRDDEAAGDATRGSRSVPNLTLKEVKKVFIEMRGAAALNDLRRSVIESLSSSGVVAATSSADEADAALKIVVSQTSGGDVRSGAQIEVSAQLVNARGRVLWPKANQRARRYAGATSKVVAEIVNDLLSEIRLARATQ